MRAGDFGEVCAAQEGDFDTNGRCSVDAGQIWDPYSGTFDENAGGAVRSTFIPFNNLATYISPGSPNLPANLQPAPGVAGNLIDPVAQKMMSLFPEPNTDGDIYHNWFGSGSRRNYNDQFDVKIDHRFTENNLISGKFAYQYSHGNEPGLLQELHGSLFSGSRLDQCSSVRDQLRAHVQFNPVDELDLWLYPRRMAHRRLQPSRRTDDPLGTLGFPSYLQSNGFKGVPAIFIDMSIQAPVTPTSVPIRTATTGWARTRDNFRPRSTRCTARTKSSSGLTAAFTRSTTFRPTHPMASSASTAMVLMRCPGRTLRSICGGDSMASFLMAQITQGDAGNGSGSTYEIQYRPATTNYQYGFFVQDNWKATPKLTLNLGLRYDVTLPRTDRYNRQNWFDANGRESVERREASHTPIAVTGQPVTIPLLGGEVFASSSQRTNYVTDWHDFQPRLGFAYQFVPKMVLRGGYGIYYGQSRSGVTGVVPYGSAGFNQYTERGHHLSE